MSKGDDPGRTTREAARQRTAKWENDPQAKHFEPEDVTTDEVPDEPEQPAEGDEE